MDEKGSGNLKVFLKCINLTLVIRRGRSKKCGLENIDGGYRHDKGKVVKGAKGLRELKNLQPSVNYGEPFVRKDGRV